MKKYIISLALVIILVGVTAVAKAADFRYSADQNGSVNVTSVDVPKDLHVVARIVNVNSNVGGDLLAAGNTITVTGNVDNSSFLIGGIINSAGNVGHHLRVAGDTVTVTGVVNGDLYAAGQTLVIDSGAVINGNAYVTGNTVTVKGSIKGGLWSRSTNLVVSGSIGSLNAESTTVELQNKTSIVGNFSYKSPNTASIDTQAKISGQTLYTKTSQSEPITSSLLTLSSLLSLLGVMLLLSLIGFFWPKTSKAIVDQFYSASLKMFFIGLLVLLIGPAALIFALFTFVGAPAALIAGGFWLVAIMLGSLFGQLSAGSWIIATLTKQSEKPIDWQAAVVGVLFFVVLGLIPLVGSLVIFILTMIGFGAVITRFFKTEKADI